MIMQGWIKVHRGMSDHFLWNSEPFSKGQAWLDLLLHANFTDNEILIKGQVIKLKRGEQARSEVTLSKRWKWSRNKVRRFLELLKKEGMIESKTTHLTSVISICNYNSFQAGDTANGTSVGTSVGTAGEQVTEHSKECKERKEGKECKEEKPQSTKADPIPYELIGDLYNEVCTNLPKVQSMGKARKKLIKSFWSDHKADIKKCERASDFFDAYFDKANNSDFWVRTQANLDTLMRSGKYENIMERSGVEAVRAKPKTQGTLDDLDNYAENLLL